MYGPSNGRQRGCFSGCRCTNVWIRLYPPTLNQILNVFGIEIKYVYVFRKFSTMESFRVLSQLGLSAKTQYFQTIFSVKVNFYGMLRHSLATLEGE